MTIELALKEGSIIRSFLWISFGHSDIYWGLTGEGNPSHFSYHESGLLHHRYDKPIPILPSRTPTHMPSFKFGDRTPLSSIKGFEPLFAGWISLHPVTTANLPLVPIATDGNDFLTCELSSCTRQPVTGFEVSLLESSRSDLIPFLSNINWDVYWVTHKIFILEKERPSVNSESRLVQEYTITDFSPWLVVRFWDGLPPVLSNKVGEWEFKGIGLTMPSTDIKTFPGDKT